MGDWTSATYIASQILTLISCGLIAYSFFAKRRVVILLVIIACNIISIAAYGLLTAWVGLGMCAVCIARDTTSFFINKHRPEKDKKKITKLDWGLLALWTALMVGITAATQQGFMTCFAFFGTYCYTIGIWQKKRSIYLIFSIASQCCWVTYTIVVQSVVGIALESALLLAAIIGLGLYCYKLRKRQLPVLNPKSNDILLQAQENNSAKTQTEKS